ncbi:MAG: T9SS type A sorting domain-containing protein [Flavobacteriales bacterium]|nr:T9SS type A sorting domain-containing protein [Flavobacteriales bacterium]
MDHTTQKNKLTDRWKAYTGMSAAFMAVGAHADGQVIYTDVDPDQVLVNDQFTIDFDNDGNQDLLILHSTTSSGGLNIQAAAVSGEVLGTVTSSFMYPLVLAAGAPIDPANPNWQASYAFGTLAIRYSYGSSTAVYGNWLGQNGYLGVRFTSGAGDTHFAWVHLSVGAQCENITIYGYAFNATPNTAINAGDDGSTGMRDAVAAALDASIFPNPATHNATLQLDAAKAGAYQVSIMNSMGQVLIAQQVNAGTGTHRFDLDLSGLAAGTYFVEVRGEDQVVMRKVTKEG